MEYSDTAYRYSHMFKAASVAEEFLERECTVPRNKKRQAKEEQVAINLFILLTSPEEQFRRPCKT
jgi:hypothetical protein